MVSVGGFSARCASAAATGGAYSGHGQFASGIVVLPMPGFVKAALKFDLLAPHIAAAAKDVIKNHTAIFVVDEEPIGSGTFVQTCGLTGILTAFHVAEKVCNAPEFLLCVVDRPHRLEMTFETVAHVVIGRLPEKTSPADGPDLSLLVFQNCGLVKKLREFKSFYPLDTTALPSFHRVLNPLIWGVAGVYRDSFVRLAQNYQGGPLSKVVNFVGTGMFSFDVSEKDEFDYLQLKVPAGEYDFPYDYHGLSGGGFWLLPMEACAVDALTTTDLKRTPMADLNTIRYRFPVLAGVEFHQSSREGRERVLTGHGPVSIYRRVRDTLKRQLEF